MVISAVLETFSTYLKEERIRFQTVFSFTRITFTKESFLKFKNIKILEFINLQIQEFNFASVIKY